MFDKKYVWKSKGEKTAATVKHGGGNTMLLGCSAASGTGILQKVDGIMKEEDRQPLDR